MLSRIADSLYWMTRYLERADATARLLEINLIHGIEAERALPEAAEWRPLLSICGNEDAYALVYEGAPVGQARVMDFLTGERRNAGSIRTSLRLARENARVVRDRISRETWEGVNDLWLRSEERLARPIKADYYRWLRSEVARFHGATSSTMMRGEAFGFYLLGLFLERADMTARIVDVKYHLLLPDLTMVGSALDYYQWAALLKSISGFEPFRRRYLGLRPIDVAEFVMLDPDFPRSLRFAIDRMQQALERIGSSRSPSPSGIAVEALDALLERGDAASVFEVGLHEFLDEFLGRVSALDQAVQEEYFSVHLGPDACAT